MNNKSLLIAIFATSFSGMTFACEDVTPETTIVTRVKSFKGFADKQIKKHCREVNSDLCQQLSTLITATDSINLEEIAALSSKIREELNAKNNSTNIVEEVTEKANEITQEICTALMVVPQE